MNRNETDENTFSIIIIFMFVMTNRPSMVSDTSQTNMSITVNLVLKYAKLNIFL